MMKGGRLVAVREWLLRDFFRPRTSIGSSTLLPPYVPEFNPSAPSDGPHRDDLGMLSWHCTGCGAGEELGKFAGKETGRP